jgi:hypothetical protein
MKEWPFPFFSFQPPSGGGIFRIGLIFTDNPSRPRERGLREKELLITASVPQA